MSCRTVDLGNGATAIVCSRSPRRRCAYCGEPAAFLCDFPTAPGKTCDRALCANCRRPIDAKTDYCIAHKIEWLQAGGKPPKESEPRPVQGSLLPE